MSLTFQTLLSSSAGNCATLCSPSCRLVLDCGLSSMKQTRQTLTLLHQKQPIDAVLLTHIHSDHIAYYPLRVLEETGLPVYLHERHIAPLKEKHYNGCGFKALNLKPFSDGCFEIGDFRIQPFEVAHHPRVATFGFEIYGQERKAVFATDFCAWENHVGRFAEADFIFVESNHDLDLLRKYYNPNSRYHLPNPETARLLAAAVGQSRRPLRTAMLGHLSSQRNTPRLALHQTRQYFQEQRLALDFALTAAPLRTPGEPVRI